MKYRTIVADPPWQTMAGPLKGGVGWQVWDTNQSRPLAYPSMALEEIAALPVSAIADEDCALFLWTINAYIEQSYSVARAWGFTPSTLLTWCKAPMGGGLGGAFGITSEYVLYARRGSPDVQRTTGTWFQWKRQYGPNGKPSHSTKPEHFYDLIESVSPAPRVELFARRHRLGWDVWGNESANTAEMPA
jgi:N6-adenosine-specific RNA methylase IME4